MKQLTVKLILPLTVISFASFTKWWYTLPVDAPDTMFTGFPLPFTGEAWHTSASMQIFMAELAIDILTYFLIWFILIFCFHNFITKINPPKLLTTGLWILTGLIFCFAGLDVGNSDNRFYPKRPFDMTIMETGYKFSWQKTERPDFYKYNPKYKK